MKTDKRKLFIYELLSVVTMLLPIIVLFIVKKEEFLLVASPFHLSLGGITALIFALIMVKGKFNFAGQRVLKFLLIFILCYVFEPLLSSLKLISFCALCGQVVNTVLFEYKIRELKKIIDAKYISEAINN